MIGLDLLPATPAIPTLAAAELVVDEILVDRHARGHAFDESDERLAVGFTRGAIGQSGHRLADFSRDARGSRGRSNQRRSMRCMLRALWMIRTIHSGRD